jgi:hypothetical protein
MMKCDINKIMHFEPLRMKRWLSMHALSPERLRKLDEKFVITKYPVLNFKVDGDTVEQNFKELKES